MPGYCVHHGDKDQFGGAVMLLAKNNVRHDQFLLPIIVNFETIAVCLYLQNNISLLFVSCYNSPNPLIHHSDLDSVFSSFNSVILVDDLNCNTQLGTAPLLTEMVACCYLTVYPRTLQ